MRISVISLVLLLAACGEQQSLNKPPHASARKSPLSQGLVISQVYTGGASSGAMYPRDYVVLYNRGMTDVNLTGWSLQYAANNGTTWTKLDLSGTVQPAHAFFVLLSGANGTMPVTPDFTGALNLGTPAGKIALVNSTTGLTGGCPTSNANVVDFVGYGTTATCFEGSGRAPATSISTSIYRRENGCTETDDNAADFFEGAPTFPTHANGAIACDMPLPDGGTPPPFDGGTSTDAGTDAGVDAGTTTDAGTDAGVDAGTPFDAGTCTLFNGWPAVGRNAGYDADAGVTFGEFFTFASPDGGRDMLSVEAWWGGGLMVPVTEEFDELSSYDTCEVCAVVGRGCTNGTDCAAYFFAQSGSVTVSSASQAPSGSISAGVTQVRFEEWDFDQDAPVENGQCVIVLQAQVSATWSGSTGGGTGMTGGGTGATGGGSATGGGTGSTGGGSGADAGTGGGSGSTGGSGGSGGGSGTGGGSEEVDAGTGGGGGTTGRGGCGCNAVEPSSLMMLALGALSLLRRRSR